jgi:hypothetical protein
MCGYLLTRYKANISDRTHFILAIQVPTQTDSFYFIAHKEVQVPNITPQNAAKKLFTAEIYLVPPILFSVRCIGLTKGVPKFEITFGSYSCNVDMNSAKMCSLRPLDGQDMLKGNDLINI